ncbi:hypothetical protein ACWEP1_27065, partial [Streptomyces sp. NPDC004285]
MPLRARPIRTAALPAALVAAGLLTACGTPTTTPEPDAPARAGAPREPAVPGAAGPRGGPGCGGALPGA